MTNVYETVMAMKHAVIERNRGYADEHLARYITNRNKRTGQTWVVVERYTTTPHGHTSWYSGGVGSHGYDRAVIVNEHGERVRIFHDMAYWRMA